jgi:hypothetical protein
MDIGKLFQLLITDEEYKANSEEEEIIISLLKRACQFLPPDDLIFLQEKLKTKENAPVILEEFEKKRNELRAVFSLSLEVPSLIDTSCVMETSGRRRRKVVNLTLQLDDGTKIDLTCDLQRLEELDAAVRDAHTAAQRSLHNLRT